MAGRGQADTRAAPGIGVRLRAYQVEAGRAVVDGVFGGRGLTISVMMARKGGKNELSAQLEVLLLTARLLIDADAIKCAPTFDPQARLSMRRLWARLLGFSTISPSDAVTSLSPAFTIQPAESGKAAVGRLLAMVPDVLFVSGEYGCLVNPTAAQATDYEYGTEHAILGGRYGYRSASFNRVQVFGQSLMVEDFDWTGVGDIYDRLHQDHDRNLTSVAAAQDRADAFLRHQEMEAADDEVLVPANCGQELYDVVEVTDPIAGLSAARRRVLGMSVRYAKDRAAPAYEMRLRLGAV